MVLSSVCHKTISSTIQAAKFMKKTQQSLALPSKIYHETSATGGHRSQVARNKITQQDEICKKSRLFHLKKLRIMIKIIIPFPLFQPFLRPLWCPHRRRKAETFGTGVACCREGIALTSKRTNASASLRSTGNTQVPQKESLVLLPQAERTEAAAFSGLQPLARRPEKKKRFFVLTRFGGSETGTARLLS